MTSTQSEVFKGFIGFCFIAIAVWAASLYFEYRSEIAQYELEQKEKTVPARFKKVTQIILSYGSTSESDWKGTVYLDKETQIEYLYIWGGAANGGPAITRFWKKGE